MYDTWSRTRFWNKFCTPNIAQVFTTFLFKLFYAQMWYFLALRVLALVVESFFERVFSHLRLFHTYLFRRYATCVFKEIKNVPSALFSYISTREEHERSAEKHEPKASAFRTSRVFLKIPASLHNSTMHEEQVFYFFCKIKTSTKGQEFVRQQKWSRILIDQQIFSLHVQA